jgi:hypothetical protein
VRPTPKVWQKVARGKGEARRPWIQSDDETALGEGDRSCALPLSALQACNALLMYQGRRASRLPLATLLPRLRRYLTAALPPLPYCRNSAATLLPRFRRYLTAALPPLPYCRNAAATLLPHLRRYLIAATPPLGWLPQSTRLGRDDIQIPTT